MDQPRGRRTSTYTFPETRRHAKTNLLFAGISGSSGSHLTTGRTEAINPLASRLVHKQHRGAASNSCCEEKCFVNRDGSSQASVGRANSPTEPSRLHLASDRMTCKTST